MAKAVRAADSAGVLLEAKDADGASDRAYYAMFNAARAALLAEGYDVDAHKTHKGVINAFSQRMVKEGLLPPELVKRLKQVEEIRILADYRGDPVDFQVAQEAVAQAAAFITAVRGLPAFSDPRANPSAKDP